MNRRLASAAVALAAVLTVAGCGSDQPTAVDAASDPTVTSSTAAGDTPTSPAPEPTWASDCDERSTSALDYGREPKGWKTPEEAVAHAGNLDLPAGTLVLAPTEPNTPTSVYVVDDATNTILAAVTVFPGSTGFYVDGVQLCA
ncbi:MAG: hypothetical protein ABIO16_07235 [Nocardioides sp.]